MYRERQKRFEKKETSSPIIQSLRMEEALKDPQIVRTIQITASLFEYHKNKLYTSTQKDLIMDLYRSFKARESLTEDQFYLLKQTVENYLVHTDPNTFEFKKPLTGKALELYESSVKYFKEHGMITKRQFDAIESYREFLDKY